MSKSLQSDIDYMKSLALAGSAGPLNNGSTLFWAGLLYGLAAVGQYAIIRGWLPQTLAMNVIVWFGASVVFAVIAILLAIGRKKAADSTTARAANHAWSAVALGVIAFIMTLFLIIRASGQFQGLYYIIAPVVLIMYGMGWWVSAAMAGKTWLKLVAFGCFLGAPVMGLIADRPEQLLAYAACLILFAMLPGLALMRAQKA